MNVDQMVDPRHSLAASQDHTESVLKCNRVVCFFVFMYHVPKTQKVARVKLYIEYIEFPLWGT